MPVLPFTLTAKAISMHLERIQRWSELQRVQVGWDDCGVCSWNADVTLNYFSVACERTYFTDALIPEAVIHRKLCYRTGLTQRVASCQGLMLRASVWGNLFPDEVFYRARICLDKCSVFSYTQLSCLRTSKMGLTATDREFYVFICALMPRIFYNWSDRSAVRKRDGVLGSCKDGDCLSTEHLYNFLSLFQFRAKLLVSKGFIQFCFHCIQNLKTIKNIEKSLHYYSKSDAII